MLKWPDPGRKLVPIANPNSDIDGTVSDYTYFGLIGLESEIDFSVYGTREFGFFERVSRRVSNGELYHALTDSAVADALLRYAPSVDFQLAVSNSLGEKTSLLALRIISALRIRTRIDLLVPAFLSVSWNELHRARRNSCIGDIIEASPTAQVMASPRVVEQSDFDWLWSSGEKFEELLATGRFALAVEALCYCHLIRDVRMRVAALWSGIEALFGLRGDLRYRIALNASSVLEERGERRFKLFKKIQKLYDVRSNAVHGALISNEELSDHVLEVRVMLAQLITSFIDSGTLPEPEDYDRLLLA